jgi:hypothetical protein
MLARFASSAARASVLWHPSQPTNPVPPHTAQPSITLQ